MATNLLKRQDLKTELPVIQWLLDSDPSIRWQVMRDLNVGAPEDVAAERARVGAEALARRCLPFKGTTGGGAVQPGAERGTRPCTS